MTLPRFLGLGAMKAGTSTLHALLATHPGVALPAQRKEVMFFDRYWDRGVDWYESQWTDVGERAPGEITPGYLLHPDAPARAASVVPDARLVVILRDPVERAVSQWRFYVKEHGWGGDLDAFLREHPNALARGFYTTQLRRWLTAFPREQLLVLKFEDFVAEPGPAFAAVCRHVGVDEGWVPPNLGQKTNASAIPRFHGLYTLGRRGIGWLYDHDLGWVVQGAKAAGLRRVFTRPDGGADDFDPVEQASRDRLAGLYADDTHALRGLVGFDPTGWASDGSAR